MRNVRLLQWFRGLLSSYYEWSNSESFHGRWSTQIHGCMCLYFPSWFRFCTRLCLDSALLVGFCGWCFLAAKEVSDAAFALVNMFWAVGLLVLRGGKAGMLSMQICAHALAKAGTLSDVILRVTGRVRGCIGTFAWYSREISGYVTGCVGKGLLMDGDSSNHHKYGLKRAPNGRN